MAQAVDRTEADALFVVPAYAVLLDPDLCARLIAHNIANERAAVGFTSGAMGFTG